ncbi:MAG: hypothetical protein CFH05_00335 [Alphaproteobacteria bacterium MarineAlpha3_Bin4]|nr:MAG: hypothetical protein CFH05_00335 [Alphaproteobacteria bacterium MarineAlpha3_Bin4]
MVIARQNRPHGLVALLVVALTLSACSQVVDAVNPAEWYRSTVDFFAGEDDKKSEGKESALAKDRGKAPPGTDQPFPNLASVDQQRAAHDNRAGGLVADPNAPQYAPAIARQGEPKSILIATPALPPTPTESIATAEDTPVQPQPQVAAQPPTATTTIEQKNFEDRMRHRLAEIQARAAPSSALPLAKAAVPNAAGTTETIIVSSSGVETADLSAVAQVLAVSAPLPGQQVLVGSRTQVGSTRVATILFLSGSAGLNARDRQILANVRRLHKERGGKLRVIGHASSRTRNTNAIRHKMINFKVSVERADAVAHELMRLGIKRSDIFVDAVSDSQPIYYEIMPSGEAGNRRAEIYLEG